MDKVVKSVCLYLLYQIVVINVYIVTNFSYLCTRNNKEKLAEHTMITD